MRNAIRFMVLVALAAFTAAALPAQQQAPAKNSPNSLPPPSQDLLGAWNYAMGKLVTMAKDFPENKYDFKVQKDQRTFAENLLHVSGEAFLTASAVKGSQVGPKFEGENPSRANYKTKADVVKLIEDALAAGADLIKTQGETGMNKPVVSPFSAHPVRASTLWWSVIEDSAEHYGQLVVYYRANNMVPPASR